MNSKPHTPITIAKIGRKFGVRGYFNLISFTSPPENILNFKSILIQYKSDWALYEVESIKPKNKNIFICKLKTISTPEEASKLTNCEAAVYREQLPNLDEREYYWVDLIGLKVCNKNGELIGTISDMIETKANDIIKVKRINKKSILIPYIDEAISNIDLNSQIMTVDWDIDNT